MNALTLTNHNVGFYEYCHHYGLAKKCKLALAFLKLKEKYVPSHPSVHQVSQMAKVGWHYWFNKKFQQSGGSWFLPTNLKMRICIIKYHAYYIDKMEHLPGKM
jgi:hypothetical protein